MVVTGGKNAARLVATYMSSIDAAHLIGQNPTFTTQLRL
jgi:hypothetical protein